MQCHSLVNVDLIVPYLRAWKKEGPHPLRRRHAFENPYLEPLASWIERGNLDFVQVNYSIFNRHAEERMLRSAAERGAAVFTNMPFEKARLSRSSRAIRCPISPTRSRRELGAVLHQMGVSNPAVTCALAATSNPDHAAQNVWALRGPLPDAAMRERMVRHMQPIAGFGRLAKCRGIPTSATPESSAARSPVARPQLKRRSAGAGTPG